MFLNRHPPYAELIYCDWKCFGWDGLGLYEPFIDFAGATVPITSFGNDLVHGALAEAEQSGIIGVVIGMFQLTSAGITSAIVFGMIGAFLFKPKS